MAVIILPTQVQDTSFITWAIDCRAPLPRTRTGGHCHRISPAVDIWENFSWS